MFCHKVLRLDHNRNSEMEGKGKGKIVAIFNIYVVSLYSTKQTKQTQDSKTQSQTNVKHFLFARTLF